MFVEGFFCATSSCFKIIVPSAKLFPLLKFEIENLFNQDYRLDTRQHQAMTLAS